MMELSEASAHRLEWRLRHFKWMLPKIMGSTADKEQFLAMFQVAMDEAYLEGIRDSKDLVDMLAAKFKHPVQIGLIANALGNLVDINTDTKTKG